MSGSSYDRRKTRRRAQRNGIPVHKPKREKVEPEPRGEAEEVFEERKEVHRELTDVRTGKLTTYSTTLEDGEQPPFLRNLEKRSWLSRIGNFFKRMWRAGK